jgi:two-component system cell cycle sensor histidine kinase/response regulator CckA
VSGTVARVHCCEIVTPPPTLGSLSIRPVLLLSFFAAGMPTAILLALLAGPSSDWYNPAAHTVLCCSTAIVQLVIAKWLASEANRIQHPALLTLSAGFAGLAILSLVFSAMHSPPHLLVERTAPMLWLVLFGGVTSALFMWTGARHLGRKWMESGLKLHLLMLLLFCVLAVVMFLVDQPLFHQEQYGPTLRTATFLIQGAGASLLLLFALSLYLRKRNTVILFFALALFLYTLAVLSQTAGEAWSVLWWFGEGLYLTSSFAVAFGVLEANRLLHRLDLIETLATKSMELQKSHLDLSHSEAQYRSLVNNAPFGIFLLNEAERFEAVNPALIETLGFETSEQVMELESCSVLFRDKQEYKSVIEDLRNTGRVEDEVFLTKKGGSPIKVRLSCRRVVSAADGSSSFEGIVENLSAQSSLEEQLRQSQKMEAVGRLAGGVAHDFNNLLTVISGYIRMLLDTFSASDPRRNDADRIKTAAERATTLTRQLLAFSRKQVLMPASLNLNAVIADLTKILPRLIGEDVELVFTAGEKLASIYADRGQVEQVLLNLIVNSRDAMPEGGKITLETCNQQLDEKYARHRRGVVPGEYVMLAVTDTGCGMDAATKARMFEPFFTTKEEGKGTGLGLAMVYGIVKQSDGHIGVYSEPGRGTTFKVYFPATSASREKESGNLVLKRLPRAETILVIEDEEDLRNMIVRALGRCGYTVLQAAHGDEALELVKENTHGIDLLVTDIVMPGMRGTEAARKLQELVPGLKVVYMSGYTDNALFHQKLLDSGSAFIQKPFTIETLEEKVRLALKEKARPQISIS